MKEHAVKGLKAAGMVRGRNTGKIIEKWNCSVWHCDENAIMWMFKYIKCTNIKIIPKPQYILGDKMQQYNFINLINAWFCSICWWLRVIWGKNKDEKEILLSSVQLCYEQKIPLIIEFVFKIAHNKWNWKISWFAIITIY